jgi:microcompartment protein CcmL/EutN
LKKAIGFIEFKSIPIGIEATDQMLKSGNVELISSSPLCPGKYVTLISGDVGAVKSSIKDGEHVGGIYLLESHVIPNIHEAVFPALLGVGEAEDIKALGVIETINAISSIVVGDAAVKAANIKLLEIRLARGLGGKGFVVLTGEVASVKQAVKAAQAELSDYGTITSFTVIPSPHKDIKKVIF